MNKKLTLSITLLANTVAASLSHATAFLPQDPRSLAMGGTGVAAGNSAQAHYYNPSLLMNAPQDEDFNFAVDVAVRFADDEQLLDSAVDFADADYLSKFANSMNSLTSSITNFLNAQAGVTLSDINTARLNLIDDSRNLQNGIISITNKSLTLDANLGTFISRPNRGIGWSIYNNNWSNASIQGVLDPGDNEVMSTFIESLEALDPNDPTGYNQQTINNILNLDPQNRLNSSVSAKAIGVVEVGVAIAKHISLEQYDFDIGITPKFQQVFAVSYERTIREIEEDGDLVNLDDYKEYYTGNIDIGISKVLSENFKTGITIKNLIPQSFKTPTSSKVTIDPAARIGANYRNNWLAFAVDLDLTENDDSASPSKSRFLSFGTELDVWLLQLRAGYRMNLSSENGNVPSLGFGLYLLGINLDAAVAANQVNDITDFDDVSASVQLGIKW